MPDSWTQYRATSADSSSRRVQVGQVTRIEPRSSVVLRLGIVLIRQIFGGTGPSFEPADDKECEDDGDEEQQYFVPTTFVSEEPCHVSRLQRRPGT